VYNAEGRRIDISREVTIASREGEIVWSGMAGGRRVPPGVYWLRARLSGSVESVQKIIIIR
jgi:hypothetical protein